MRCASSSAGTFLPTRCGGLGRRDGPDPVRAVHLLQIWDRLRWRTPRHLIDSVPDVLASSANYLKGLGWRCGGALAQGSPRTGKHGLEPGGPQRRAYGRGMGAHGRAGCEWRPCSRRAAGIAFTPMGRMVAFLAFHNFKVYLEWNQSLVYSTTAAYLATRIAGAPAVSRGRGVVPFGYEQTKLLQGLLRAKVTMSARSTGSSALRRAPASRKSRRSLACLRRSYPSPELIARLDLAESGITPPP